MEIEVVENELFVAKDKLSNIASAIEGVAGNAVSAAGNFLIGNRIAAAGDGVHAAVSLANPEARQRARIYNLNRMLKLGHDDLRFEHEKLSIVERDIQNSRKALAQNNC